MIALDQPYTFVLISSVIISISMCVSVLMHRPSPGVYAFAALKAAIGLWAFTSLFEICSPVLGTKIFSYSFKYVFIVIVPPAWFVFGLHYSNRLHTLRWTQMVKWSVLPAITLIMVATNRYHQWMFTSLEIVETSSYLFVVRDFGPWFWVHAGYSYLLLFLGFFFMAKQLIDAPSPYRYQGITLLIGGLTPWAANMVFTFKLMPYPYLDLTPFAFTISGIAFMWGIVRFQLLDMVPVAQDIVMQHLDDGILVLDNDQRIVNINPAAERFMDVPHGMPIGTKACEAFSWWTQIENTPGPTSVADMAVIDLSVNNQRRLLRYKQLPLYCNQKQTGLLITLHDITDTLLAKEALHNSEERFRSLSENAPIVIFTLDTACAITYVNPAWEVILGHSSDNCSAKPFIQFVADEDGKNCERIFQQLIRRQLPVAEFNVKMQPKQGRHRCFRANIAVNCNAAGEVTDILGLAKDVTEELELQKQLIQSQKMEAIGTLAGGVAHDFNNLLMGMQANVSLMLLEVGPGSSLQEKLQRIENQIQSGGSLTRHLLGFARQGKYVVTSVDMPPLINDTLELVRRTNKNIKVQSLFPDAPNCINADRGQMELVLLNLFINAADAMPDGGQLTVSSRRVEAGSDNSQWPAQPKRDHIEIMVADSGIGMDDATQARIFEPFFTTKAMGQGTGLGLASVYGVIQNHDGHIRVASCPGEGTTFTLLFPTADEADSQAFEPNKPMAVQPNIGNTILLVEDEPLILKYSREMVQSLELQVIAVDNGKEALQIFEERGKDIDVVILDMIMPGLDGWAVFQRLKKADPQIRVIITSGYTADQRIDQIVSDQRHAYLNKPYTREELAGTIAAVLAA